MKGTATAPVCVEIGESQPTLPLLRTAINAILNDKESIVGSNSGGLSYALESIREVEF